jgi:hypothetical protein
VDPTVKTFSNVAPLKTLINFHFFKTQNQKHILKTLPNRQKTLILTSSRIDGRPHEEIHFSFYMQDIFLSNLKALHPELCITAAYGNILPSKFLNIPPLG